MPELPAGERALRSLAERFSTAEAQVRDLVGHAPTGDRRELAAAVAAILTALRRLDAHSPVKNAYLTAFKEVKRGGAASPGAEGLAASLASKLDRAAQTASANAREAIRPIGRTATSRGVVDAMGPNGKLIFEVSGCDYCSTFEGETVVGEPLPPLHPSCTCVASPA